VNIIPFLVSYNVNNTSSTNVNGRIREVIMCYLRRCCYSHTYGSYCEHSAIVIVAYNATLNVDYRRVNAGPRRTGQFNPALKAPRAYKTINSLSLLTRVDLCYNDNVSSLLFHTNLN